MAKLNVEHYDWLRGECSRLNNGECTTARCIKRGGWQGGPYDPAIATCVPYEIYRKLQEGRTDGTTN